MAALSAVDTELLAQDLPRLAQVAVASPVYPGKRGHIEYRAAGDARNPAVLLLHGLGSNSVGYRAQLAGLSREFHVIAWNAPGFGGSTPIPEQDVAIDDYADALAAFLRALRVKRLSALVGSSWGSVVALTFAKNYPALVDSLILSAPNIARGHLVGDARAAELNAWLCTADIDIPVSRAAIADRLLTPDTPSSVRQHVERLRDAMTTDGWRQAIRSLFTAYAPDMISAVRCPIAILSGTRDQVAPHRDHAERLLAAAPGATSHPFEDCGHMLKLEAPAKFNAIVRQMAAETWSGTSTATMRILKGG
ncbi:alpha/beta fold hydrolase [Bradyrhizobium iriomotense]|uniref:Alpha/beta hydrolase n=1 Tax=Bradyrhizobium iriomotense TaxID=441950 RepID=A0ABQ6ANH2_9BRAD|nr:alpha/beta fold hydrolase [Bradyrhizobium iriomotense]GLR83624.1 alpha/beta hydrolase [Bradyrhizobium iriomotense]